MDFRLAFYVPHHPIHKLREKTSKDDLFGLILLIYSIFHHFPREFLSPSPGKTSLGPHNTALFLLSSLNVRRTLEQEISFPPQTFRQRETPKLDKRVKSAGWLSLKILTRGESPELGEGKG